MTLKVLQIGISSCKIIEIQSKSFTQKTFNIFKGVQNVKNAIGKKGQNDCDGISHEDQF